MKTKCQETTASTGSPCTHPAKLIAVDGAGQEKWVCGVHSNVVEEAGWSLRPLERFQPDASGRGVSGWLMVPMRVTVDTKGVGRIVEAHPYWEMARVARDDFGQDEDFEVAEPMLTAPPFWQGVDELDAEGRGTMRMLRPTPAEKERWNEIVFEDIQQFIEEESEPLGYADVTWVPSAVAYGQPEQV